MDINSVSITAESRVGIAPQWQLVWWRFRKHRLALVSGILVILVYLVALFAPFLAPYTADQSWAKLPLAPPQPLNWIEHRDDGSLRFYPYVYGIKGVVRLDLGKRIFTLDETQKIPITFFTKGEPYSLLGIQSDLHLLGTNNPDMPVFLLGADNLGRDVFSRIIYGTTTSMTIGLVGVALSLILGVLLGGLSGYYGGTVDNIIQRVVEFLRTMPSIPLWMGLAAAIPLNWDVSLRYFFITIILSLIGWTGLARVVRGRFLSLRSEDFVMAAKFDGCGPVRIILVHMVPSFLSHIIASITLAIPGMILSETALSFLGLGLRPPAVSWGVLLQDAQNVRSVAQAPWLLTPAIAVIIAVLALNFLGDGLRDAADPYG